MGLGTEVFRIVGTLGWQNMDKTLKELSNLESKASAVAKNIGKIAKEVDRFGLQMSKAFTVPLAAAGTAIGALALKTGDYADKILSMQEATGVSAETLQQFAHVAKTAGGSSDALFATITKLNGKLPAIADGTGKTAEAFARLGIDVKNADGSYRNMDTLFPEIIKGLQGVGDQTERNVLAYEIFGGASKEVSQFLGMSTAEMARLRGEATQLGLVMSDKALKSANDFKIGVENLKERVAALGRDLASQLMPVLNNTLIPLIQTTVIPALKSAANSIGAVAKAFTALPDSVKKAAIVFGAVIAALGPMLLIGGKVLLWGKGLIPVFAMITKGAIAASAGFVNLNAAMVSTGIAGMGVTKAMGTVGVSMLGATKGVGALSVAMGTSVLALPKMIGGFLSAKVAAFSLSGALTAAGGAYKAFVAAMVANPLGVVIAAVASLGLAVFTLHRELKTLNEIKEQNKISDAFSEDAKNLIKIKKEAKEAADSYAKLYEEGKATTEEVNEKKEAYAQAAVKVDILIKEQQRYNEALMQGLKEAIPLSKEEKDLIEQTTRARIAGFKSADDMRKAAYDDAEAQRKAKEAAEEATKKAIELNKKRKSDLESLVKENQDAIDQMTKSEEQLLNMKELAAVEAAEKLGASEKDLDIIRERFWQENKKRIDAEAEEARKAEEEKQKAIADVNADWQNKLLHQSGNKQAILDAERKAAVENAEKTGSDVAAVQQYYDNEQAAMDKEAADKRYAANKVWTDKLNQQELDGIKDRFAARMAEIDIEEAEALSKAAESGEDMALIEQVYANERVKVEQEANEKIKQDRKAMTEAVVDSTMSSVSKLGSIMSQFSSNEEKRVSKDYKDKRAYIEANVKDEEARKAQLAALDEEEDAKKLEIQQKQAKRDKALGIFTTLVDTARAVVKTLAEMGPIAGPIMAAVIAGLGIAQTAAIASTPEPFEAGGLITGGKGGVHGLVGEGRQDELILPMETGTAKLAEQLMDKMGSSSVSNRNYTININAGTVVADDYSAKQFAMKINHYIVQNDQRRGLG